MSTVVLVVDGLILIKCVMRSYLVNHNSKFESSPEREQRPKQILYNQNTAIKREQH